MFDLQAIKNEFKNCPCGKEHELTIKDVVIGSGVLKDVGVILKRNGFFGKLLFVADENTLRAADGILKTLEDFELTVKMYRDLRVATMEEVGVIKSLLQNCDGVISVGTGSLNDICRAAAADLDKPLCIFGTAASMDGFASYCAPLTDGNFKITYPAKSPEVVIADTKILSKAPGELKGAGFGDMVGKYVGLIDWQVSALITGEYYCERVASLTRRATDKIMALADRIQKDDEESASAVFEALLLTGIAMSFVKISRPASGTEHILSHFWECKKLLKGELSDFHGKKVGVATLIIMKIYQDLYNKQTVKAHNEIIDWQDIYEHYGALKEEVIKLNTPDTITDGVLPQFIEQNWQKIRDIIASVPSYDEIYLAMKKAGCATTCEEINVDSELKEEGIKYHPFMRKRMSLRRLANMID
jgi:glycerol-1-phosphate dehydrogenase [NAD(P)+]